MALIPKNDNSFAMLTRRTNQLTQTCNRRQFLMNAGGGIGAIALASLLDDECTHSNAFAETAKNEHTANKTAEKNFGNVLIIFYYLWYFYLLVKYRM